MSDPCSIVSFWGLREKAVTWCQERRGGGWLSRFRFLRAGRELNRRATTQPSWATVRRPLLSPEGVLDHGADAAPVGSGRVRAGPWAPPVDGGHCSGEKQEPPAQGEEAQPRQDGAGGPLPGGLGQGAEESTAQGGAEHGREGAGDE